MAWLSLLQSALKALGSKEPAANAFNLCHAVIDVHYQSEDTNRAPASEIESPSSLSASWRDDVVVRTICGNGGNTTPRQKSKSNHTATPLVCCGGCTTPKNGYHSSKVIFVGLILAGVRGYLEIQAHQQYWAEYTTSSRQNQHCWQSSRSLSFVLNNCLCRLKAIGNISYN